MEVRFPSDERPPAWKIAFLQYVIAASFFGLLVGYWRLQIGEHRQYADLADRNRIRNLPIIAPRGRILDREGRVLADNFPAFSVLLMRESAAILSPDRIAGIARGLQLDPVELRATLERTASLPRFQPVLLKQAATLEDISFLESHRVEYPELDLIQVQQRLYPKLQVGAAMLGYVGEVPEEMIAKLGSSYKPGDVIGKFGVEAEYNQVLAGRDGMRRVVVNSRGQEVGVLSTINAQAGNDLRLTIDLDLQMAAEAGLGDQSGAVVALDPRTGEVLAMVSHPSFDPNDFAKRIDPKEWEQLTNDPMKPLMNKAIQAQLAPGSVFKIVMASAVLETGTITPDFIVNCAGAVTIYGHLYHDWVFEKHRAHGAVNVHSAIRESCDVFFYTMGKMLGIDKIDYYAKGLGLGAKTGIDLPGEASGLIPSPEWVERNFKHKWYAGETISVAIGQGADLATPLQLANTIGGVAMGGVFHRPHLAFQDQLRALGVDPPDSSPHDFPLSENTIAAVKSGMWAVVNEGGGTGGAARCPGIDISGKTGTAQVVSQTLQQSAKSSEFKNTAWFVGYAPSDKPEIVVAALVMRGEHSTVAVPIVRDVIKAYFDKKLRPKTPANQMESQVRVLSQLRTPSPRGQTKSALGQQ
ncbi:MAG: penicillin-binding protein 2 [Terriglobia bacterium]